MQFKATIISVVALMGATQVIGAAIDSANGVTARSVLIATSPYYACNCPNNCSYKEGTGCRYYSGPSDDSDVISGKCQYQGSQLNCVAT